MTCVENSWNNIIIKPAFPLRFSYSLGNSIYLPSFPTQISSSVLPIPLHLAFLVSLATYLHTLSSQFPYTPTSREDHHHHHHHLFLVLKKEEKRKKKEKNIKRVGKFNQRSILNFFSLFRLNATCITLKKGIMRTQTPNHHRLYSSAWSRIHLIPSSRNVSGSTKASAETFASQTIFSGLSRLYWGHAGALSGHDTS